VTSASVLCAGGHPAAGFAGCRVATPHTHRPQFDKSVLNVSPNSLSTWREVMPPDWVPWSLLGAGAVVMLYSFTIPQRVNAG
jgi:hypothetical protein